MRLTEKQELFSIEYVMNGGDATKAYKSAYNTKTDRIATIYKEAHKLLKNPKIAHKVHELQMLKFGGVILSLKERKEILSANGKFGDHKSIDILNRMEGVYDTKEEVDDQEITINFNVVANE